MNDNAAVLSRLSEVALVPKTRKAREVGALILLAIRIIPKADRHGGKGVTADKFALVAADRPARVVDNVDVEPERGPLDLSAPHGLRGITKDETTADVRSTRDGGQMDVALYRVVDVLEAFGCEWRAGR